MTLSFCCGLEACEWADMRMLGLKVLSACWMCSVSMSITVGVFLFLPWVNFDVVSHVCCSHRACCLHAKPWP